MSDDTIHVVPIEDLIEHEESEGCVCGPEVESVDSGWLVVHHSLDGRELQEEGEA